MARHFLKKKKDAKLLSTHLFAELVVMALEIHIVDKHRDRSVVQCKLCSNIAPRPVRQCVCRHAQCAHPDPGRQLILNRIDSVVQSNVAIVGLLHRPSRIRKHLGRVQRSASGRHMVRRVILRGPRGATSRLVQCRARLCRGEKTA